MAMSLWAMTMYQMPNTPKTSTGSNMLTQDAGPSILAPSGHHKPIHTVLNYPLLEFARVCYRSHLGKSCRLLAVTTGFFRHRPAQQRIMIKWPSNTFCVFLQMYQVSLRVSFGVPKWLEHVAQPVVAITLVCICPRKCGLVLEVDRVNQSVDFENQSALARAILINGTCMPKPKTAQQLKRWFEDVWRCLKLGSRTQPEWTIQEKTGQIFGVNSLIRLVATGLEQSSGKERRRVPSCNWSLWAGQASFHKPRWLPRKVSTAQHARPKCKPMSLPLTEPLILQIILVPVHASQSGVHARHMHPQLHPQLHPH